MNKEFRNLRKENKKIREDINKLLDMNITKTNTKKYFKVSVWEKINELIDNEVEQEKFCGE
jgi:hypothetical protein